MSSKAKICTKCGAANEQEAVAVKNPTVQVPSADAPTARAAAAAAVQAPPTTPSPSARRGGIALINCHACGHRISPRARHCTKCGVVNEQRKAGTEKPGLPPRAAVAHTPPARPGPFDAPPIQAAPAPQAAAPQSPAPAQSPAPPQAAAPPQSPSTWFQNLGAEPAADSEASSEEWYYVSSAGRRGPIAVKELEELAASGEIAPTTLIWKSGLPDWIAFSSRHQFPEEIPVAEPLPAAPGRDLYSWALSLAPLWGTLIQVMSTDSRIALTHEKLANYSEMWWIMAGLNVLAAYLDLRRFNRRGAAGEPIDRWWCLAVPVYIYRRDRIAQTGPAKLWVWIGSLLLSLATYHFLNGIYTHQIIG